jgi:curved DNA-binding protein CbpA
MYLRMGSATEGDLMNYYEILQIDPNASEEVIRAAYRAMSKRYHPDLQQGGNDAMMKKINEAYEVLSDPQRRREYDAQMESRRAEPQEQQYEAHRQGAAGEEEKIPVNAFTVILGCILWLIQGIGCLLYYAWGFLLLLIIIGFFTGHSQLFFRELYDWVLSLLFR